MHVLSVSSLKGGVGKTTVALGLASAALNRGINTLVIDLDPQCDATSGLAAPSDQGYSVAEVLQTGKRMVGLLDLEPVGNYGIKPTFSDGHDSGIFSWTYLYHLASRQAELWAEYERRLAEECKLLGPLLGLALGGELPVQHHMAALGQRLQPAAQLGRQGWRLRLGRLDRLNRLGFSFGGSIVSHRNGRNRLAGRDQRNQRDHCAFGHLVHESPLFVVIAFVPPGTLLAANQVTSQKTQFN